MNAKSLFDLQGKIVLITGAGRGIGRALAEGFLEAGAIVYGTGRAPESVEWMKTTGIRGLVYDIREKDKVEQTLKQIISEHGRLDCLINNAGVTSHTLAVGYKEDEIDDMFAINFKGALWHCQSYYRLQKKKGGVIINISSSGALRGLKATSVYAASKAAIVQLGKSLSVEWVRNGFRVNTIAPGFIETDMTSNINSKPGVREQIVETIPMKRIGRPRDILGPALFLASEASAYMTGELVVVDGGMYSSYS